VTTALSPVADGLISLTVMIERYSRNGQMNKRGLLSGNKLRLLLRGRNGVESRV
jgi:hypothetical protein